MRLMLVIGIAVACFATAGGYLLYAKQRQDAAAAAAPDVAVRADLAAIISQPHLVFRNTALGEGYGRVAAVPLSDPGGGRAITQASCDRVYAHPAGALCLAANRGLTTTYTSTWLSTSFEPVRDLPLVGLPSRARISADGTLAATTTFVYGDSYANPGQFSTRTNVSRTDGSSNVDLERFALVVDGQPTAAVDRNLWGVTFVNDDTFYATAATGGKTWLVKGSISGERMDSIRSDVECPSLSPDGTRIAFKKHGTLRAGSWRLAVLDLTTWQQTLLAEERSVDDQVEWLDNGHILYGLPRDAEATASTDIWSVPADGTGTPQIFVRDAWSPAVVGRP
jgi:hypothetical protein